jgi:hypothetical protein
MKIKLLFCAFLLLTIHSVSGQYYETGQDPASLKWKQIKTGSFTIIYPEKYGSGGKLYAKALDEAYSKLTLLFPEQKFNIPVIIHNYSITSNGYVAWAPRRMELYPTPEQNGIPMLPEKQLAIHELAHVFQMTSLNQGFSKVMSLFFGEQFTGITAALLPTWLLEGDAVFAESVLTQSGRGRNPAFQKHLKALLVDKKKAFNYDKILNGSYKDFVPDNYESGYQMVAWALAKRDPQIWNKVLKYTAKEPFTLNPVNISLSKNSGLKKKSLWEETCDTLKTIWTKDVSENNPLNYETANPDKHGTYINFYSPVYAGADSIIAIKTSLSSAASFVLINPVQKTEKRIHVPGQISPWFISFAKGKLVWVETQPDPRWANREYSVIKLMDIINNRVIRLSRKSRYLSASLSPDGNTIIALENTINNTNNLVVIDANTGGVKLSVSTPGDVSLQHPQWSDDGEKVTFIFLTTAGEGIMSYELKNQQWETLIDASRNDLQSGFLKNDSLFFISSSSGTENIYLLTPDKKIIKITHSKFGVTDAGPGGNRVYFSDYTFLGNNICSTAISSISGDSKDHSGTSAFLINRFDINPPETDSITAKYYPEPYKKMEHLFRFHSWMPFYVDIEELKADPTSVRPGISIMTQNTLSTLTSTIGYEYSSDKRNVIHSRITWEGMYPVIESQLDYGTSPVISKLGENVSNPSDVIPGISFTNTISVPLRFSSGRFSEFLQPSLSVDYINQYIYIKEKGVYDYGQTIISGRLYFSNYHLSATRDIYPKWAQVIDLNYRSAPFDNTIYGSSVSLKSAFYFPGFFPNNGIKLKFETEKQYPEKYLYKNFVSLPRGYSNIYSKQISYFSFNYVLPLAYPDFNIASLIYIKRIRTGLFYDYAEGPGNSIYLFTANGLTPLSTTSERTSLKSFGLEFLADFHVLRIPYEISGGIQSAWKNTHELPSIEVLFNISLYGMTFGRKRI